MALRGEKFSTRDVDLIVETKAEAEELTDILTKLGFVVNTRPKNECRRMVDALVLAKGDGPRIDLFVVSVCEKLVLSEGMRSRSQLHSVLGRLSLRLCAREDIFFLKSVTEREKDLEDRFVLYQVGIDKEIVLRECELQSLDDASGKGRIYEAFLLAKLEEMEDRFDISLPWKERLRRIVERKLETKLVLERLARGGATVAKLSTDLGLPRSQVRAVLKQLEISNSIVIDRTRRPFVISARDRACS